MTATPAELNLTPPEKRLFQLFNRNLGKDVEIDRIIETLRAAPNRKAPSRQAATVRIKYFTAKVAPHGWVVERTSGIGRGVTGTYQMTQKF